MIDLYISPATVTLNVLGISKLWSLKSRLTFPTPHLESVHIEENAHIPWFALRAPGTYLPGIIAAGTFYMRKSKIFVDIREGHPALVLNLQHEAYNQLIFQTKDLQADLVRLQEVIARRRG